MRCRIEEFHATPCLTQSRDTISRSSPLPCRSPGAGEMRVANRLQGSALVRDRPFRWVGVVQGASLASQAGRWSTTLSLPPDTVPYLLHTVDGSSSTCRTVLFCMRISLQELYWALLARYDSLSNCEITSCEQNEKNSMRTPYTIF